MTLKNSKINGSNKITFSINGMMKVGKSTFINSILGFPLSKTALQRETLMQPIFTYSKTKTNNMKIAKKIETINKDLKESNEEITEIQECNFNVKTGLFKSLFNFENCLWEMVDSMGLDEIEEKNNKANLNLLLKNTYYTDVYFFITEPRKGFMQGSETKILKKLLNDIKNKDITTKLVIIVNRIDEIDDDDVNETMERCKKTVNDINPDIDLTIIPYSSKFVGLYRQFTKNNDINNLDNNSDMKKLIQHELGNNKKFIKLLDQKNFDVLNKKLKDSIADNDWEETFGYNKLKKYITELKTDDILYNQYNNMLKDTFINSINNNNDIFEEIMLKLKWTNTYKKNKHWNKIKNNFEKELFSLLNKLETCYIGANSINDLLDNTQILHDLFKAQKYNWFSKYWNNVLSLVRTKFKFYNNTLSNSANLLPYLNKIKYFLPYLNNINNKFNLVDGNVKNSTYNRLFLSVLENYKQIPNLTYYNDYKLSSLKNENWKNHTVIKKEKRCYKTETQYYNELIEKFNNMITEGKDIYGKSYKDTNNNYYKFTEIKRIFKSADNLIYIYGEVVSRRFYKKEYNRFYERSSFKRDKEIYTKEIYNSDTTELSFDIYNSENFMEEYDVSVRLKRIGNVYNYYRNFINNVIDNKLLFNDTKVTLIQNFFEVFEEIYTNYDMFSAIIKNYVKVHNQNSSKYLNKFFLYHIEKILKKKLYNTKNLDSVFKEKTFKVLDLYCNLMKNKEQSKENNNSTTNTKTLNV